MIPVRSFHIKLRQAIDLYFLTSVPFFESFITRIVLPSTNHPGTSPTSFKAATRTPCTAVKDFNQKLWILSGPTPLQSGIDFNFLLTSSLVTFSVFCFSDGIFSFTLPIHPASRLCSTFVLHIHFQNAVASSAFGGLSFLLYLQDFFEKPSLVGLEIPLVLKLFYSVDISFYFSGFCSYSLLQFFHYQCKPFSAHTFDLANLSLCSCPFSIFYYYYYYYCYYYYFIIIIISLFNVDLS